MGLLEKAKKIRKSSAPSKNEEELEKKELEKWEEEAKESLQTPDTES